MSETQKEAVVRAGQNQARQEMGVWPASLRSERDEGEGGARRGSRQLRALLSQGQRERTSCSEVTTGTGQSLLRRAPVSPSSSLLLSKSPTLKEQAALLAWSVPPAASRPNPGLRSLPHGIPLASAQHSLGLKSCSLSHPIMWHSRS